MRDNGGTAMRWYSTVVITTLLAVLAGGFAWSQHRRPVPGLVDGDGAGPARAMADRPPASVLATAALADLRALTGPDGAVLAGPHGPWRYVWPRDASFAAAAYCAADDVPAGLKVLGFLDRIRPRSGRWAARYLPDGSVPDRRSAQLDGSGWVPWAAGVCAAAGAPYAALQKLWPMIRQSADQAVSELRRDGLPNPSPDYWERHREPRPTLGTAAPLLAGLRAAATLADRLDNPRDNSPAEQTQAEQRQDEEDQDQDQDEQGAPGRGQDEQGPPGLGQDEEGPPEDAGAVERRAQERRAGGDAAAYQAAARSWRAAAERLADGIDGGLGSLGYPRSRRGGADSIVTVLGPPFAPERERVTAAIERSRRLLTLPNGGVTPGQDWRADGIAWTPSTALFGLSAAARGDRSTAAAVLRLLDRHRTPAGDVPEKITRSGKPAGEAPLAWTSALIVLTAAELR